MIDILSELRNFDITEIGDLYLTSGGRVVLNTGYGEYFTDSDKVIFTIEGLKSGIKYKEFIDRLQQMNPVKVK